MSGRYSAQQFEQAFLPKRLCNWQQPEFSSAQSTGTAQWPHGSTSGRRTTFIADNQGHLAPGMRKPGTSSFRIRLGPADSAPTRWPKPSLTVRAAPSATMGYKGLRQAAMTGATAGGYPGVVATRLPERSRTSAGGRQA